MMKKWGASRYEVKCCEYNQCSHPFHARDFVFSILLYGGFEHVFCSERCVIHYLLSEKVTSHEPLHKRFRMLTFLPEVGKGALVHASSDKRKK